MMTVSTSTTPLSPREWYQQILQQPGFIADASQAAAIELLEKLYQELLVFKTKRHRLFGHTLLNPTVPRGLYFWGGVGRGKSILMDAFYQGLPYRRKRRIHFHHFMQEVHLALRELHHEEDPLQKVAAHIARKTRVLCFDEFHVSDIADAMMLSRLLLALLGMGVVFVLTSNYPPEGLYPNGLQRENFLPAIALLQSWLTVVNVDGGNDYRLRTLTREPLYLTPLQGANERLDVLYARLRAGQEQHHDLVLFERKIPCVRRCLGIVWFDFLAICDGPRAQTDYLEIARVYHTVFISALPKLGPARASAARRLTWLVDVFYDSRVKLILSAAVPMEMLYTEGTQAVEFTRTVSRLIEMQSTAYLALEHLPPVN